MLFIVFVSVTPNLGYGTVWAPVQQLYTIGSETQSWDLADASLDINSPEIFARNLGQTERGREVSLKGVAMDPRVILQVMGFVHAAPVEEWVFSFLYGLISRADRWNHFQ